MDKRTLIFVFSLTLALFGINMYFENQNLARMKEWNEQQRVKKTKQLAELSSEIEQKTISIDTFPQVKIRSEESGPIIATGYIKDGQVLTLAWDSQLPKDVFIEDSSGKKEKVALANTVNAAGDPAIYQTKKGKLQTASISLASQQDLQLLEMGPEPKVFYAFFDEGAVAIPVEKREKLERELSEEVKKEALRVGPSLVLARIRDAYLPIGVFHPEGHLFTPLTEISFLNALVDNVAGNKDLTPQTGSEKYYVLENEFQQLVFSTKGGALVEINLPFKSNTNPQSVVRQIEFDREMVAKHPYNAVFPNYGYYQADDNGKQVYHEKGHMGGFYPLIRRDLILSPYGKSIKVPPAYYAFNLVSQYPELSLLNYEVKEFTKDKIVFEAVQSNRRITKTFKLDPQTAPYCLEIDVKIDGDNRGIWLTTGVPEVEWISGSPAPALKYRITRNGKPAVEQLDLPQETITMGTITPDWVVNSNGFFGIIMDPLSGGEAGFRAQRVSGEIVPSRLVAIDRENSRFKPADLPGYLLSMPLKQGSGSTHFRIFGGPFADSILRQVDKVYSDPVTGYTPDYIAAQSFHGWFAFISEPFAKFLFVLMNFFHYLTNSWALSIILLTIALRIMLYPLTAWSTKSMIKMQQISPEVTALQEKYKKDPKQLQIEIMNLYREKGVNPFSGCFPLLIQMPFLIGMFDLLKSTFELRGACFIPGWIDNLTAPDVLFSWSYPLPFIGNQFHLLPILLGAVMYFQQKFMTTQPKDPSMLTEQQRQQRAMGTMMTVVFTVMFYHFPSGLNIYWLSSMLLGILQQWWTQRSMQAAAPAAAPGSKTIVLPKKETKEKANKKSSKIIDINPKN